MTLEEVTEVAADAMDDILRCFKPGMKITVLVRNPDNPQGDFCLTDDDLAEVALMVERRRAKGPDIAQISVTPIRSN